MQAQAQANGTGNDEFKDLIINSGAKIQAGGYHAIRLQNGAKVDTITNNGQVSAGGQNQAGIIMENNNNTVKTLNNNGTLSGSGYGLYLGGSNNIIETLNNSGTITGYQGIRIDGSNTIKNLNNTGTITGTNNGVLNLANSAKIETLNNGGTISGTININNSSIDTFTNSNSINGNINISNNGSIATFANSGTISGSISIDNSSINTFTNSNSINGNININNSGSISAFTNGGSINGSISINNTDGSIGTFTNTGTINNSVSVNNGGITTLQNNGSASINTVYLNNTGTIQNINNAGRITLIHTNQTSNVKTIENSNHIDRIMTSHSSIIDKVTNGSSIDNITLYANSSIKTIDNNGEIGRLGVDGITTKVETVNNNGSIGGVNATGEITTLNNNGSITTNNTAITIRGENSQVVGKIKTLNNSSNGTIQGDGVGIALAANGAIDILTNEGQILGGTGAGIQNLGTITTLDNKGANASISSILNGESGTIANLSNENSANIDTITNAGTITTLDNKGSIDTLNNTQTIDTLKNEGTINKFINAGTITNTVTNKGTLDIDNTMGSINQGIVNEGGTLSISNYDGSNITAKLRTNNDFGKTDSGVHIENKGSGTVNIKGWYFNGGEFNSKEDRLNNSILVGGDNLGGIKAEKIYVNVGQTGKVYDANTLFADASGNAVGNQVNNGEGIDISSLENINPIFGNFIDVGGGRYSAHIVREELSGKTLAKSIIYSSRLRYINVSNILRDISGKTFKTDFTQTNDIQKSKKGEAYGNDADLLSELDDIFVKHKNASENYFTFIMPYYNYSSVNLGQGLGRLKGNTSGLIGGSQRNLPNDKGIIGFYLGYEQSNKDQSIQRLEFDDKTYYGGLTYYNVFARSGINEYFISASTRFDYTSTDITKTYINRITKINSDTKIYGYGADVKLGANYFNTLDIAMFSPEIGLSYQGMSSKNFTLRHLGGLDEHYNASQVNFLDAIVALKWQRPWSDKIRTTAIFGSLINIYNDASGDLILRSAEGNTKLSEDIQSSKWYSFTQLGLSYALKDNIDLSFNYGATLGANQTYSHNVFLKLGIWW